MEDLKEHFAFKVTEKCTEKKYEFISNKIKYTQWEIIYIFDNFQKYWAYSDSKNFEDISKVFPWRGKESLKNFWKTIKNKKLTLETALKNEYKDSAYCFNSASKVEPHKYIMADVVVERFVKKAPVKWEEEVKSQSEVEEETPDEVVVNEIQEE